MTWRRSSPPFMARRPATASRRRSSCARFRGRACRHREDARRRISSASIPTNGMSSREELECPVMSATSRKNSWHGRRGGRRRSLRRRAVRQRAGGAARRDGDIVGLTADLGKVHRHPPFSASLPRSLLQCRHGGAEPHRRVGRPGASRQGCILHHLWRLRHAARL